MILKVRCVFYLLQIVQVVYLAFYGKQLDGGDRFVIKLFLFSIIIEPRNSIHQKKAGMVEWLNGHQGWLIGWMVIRDG